jgi:ATP-binding cassette, subfamily B, bacterial
MSQPRSSRQRYQSFVKDYQRRRLDDPVDGGEKASPKSGKTRRYLREYMRWLWPQRFAAGGLLLLALCGAGLSMVEPLFMRYIVDRVLLKAGLDGAARLSRLNLAGGLFVALIVASNLVGAWRDYRQRLLNPRGMLTLRRSLFERLLHLPLPKLWEMKTGGILSRLTGDLDTTSGLLQMAIVSPSVAVIRLAIAVVVLTALNWRLALAVRYLLRHGGSPDGIARLRGTGVAVIRIRKQGAECQAGA